MPDQWEKEDARDSRLSGPKTLEVRPCARLRRPKSPLLTPHRSVPSDRNALLRATASVIRRRPWRLVRSRLPPTSSAGKGGRYHSPFTVAPSCTISTSA
eukprot:scaffold6944_cov41-Tisochrysis_lutea.AAC.1